MSKRKKMKSDTEEENNENSGNETEEEMNNRSKTPQNYFDPLITPGAPGPQEHEQKMTKLGTTALQNRSMKPLDTTGVARQLLP